MSKYIQSNQVVNLPVGNVNINVNDTGKIFLIPGQGNATITLPTPIPGLHFSFYLTGAVTAAASIIITTGVIAQLGGSIVAPTIIAISAGATNLSFEDVAESGAFIDAYSFNNTSYSILGGSQILNGIIAT